MLQNFKLWILSITKGLNDYLQAHPKVKNWLDGLEKAVIASVLTYGAMIVNHLTDGTPLPVNLSHGLLVGIAGGFFIVVSGAIKAYCQNLHDIILAANQDNVMALPIDVPLPTTSTLTPISAPVKATPPSVKMVQPNFNALTKGKEKIEEAKKSYTPILRKD